MLFNEALVSAAEIALRHLGHEGGDVVLVRDLYGKIRVVLPDDRADAADALGVELLTALGAHAYAPESAFLKEADVRAALDSAHVVGTSDTGARALLVDRLLTGTEWSAPPNTQATAKKRFTLFSMKGGVGRSTTASILAWHLARKGKHVLVLDLDLESPGVGTTLLGPSLPRLGIVDWFVEDALGQGDLVLPDMVATSDLGVGTGGKVTVVPCFGTDTGDYLPKLGRAYLERGPTGREPWPDRLKRLVAALEERENPDVVLLDSRTGLHDTSASLMLAMGADTLMFAVDSRQTWTAYQFLFEHWHNHPHVREFRHRLWVVGSMVPRQRIDEYFEGLRDHAHELFEGTLYDQPPTPGEGGDPGDTADVFHYPPTDEAGNHHPRPVLWDDGLVAFDPLSAWQEGPVTAAYTRLFEWFDQTFIDVPVLP